MNTFNPKTRATFRAGNKKSSKKVNKKAETEVVKDKKKEENIETNSMDFFLLDNCENIENKKVLELNDPKKKLFIFFW